MLYCESWKWYKIFLKAIIIPLGKPAENDLEGQNESFSSFLEGCISYSKENCNKIVWNISPILAHLGQYFLLKREC